MREDLRFFHNVDADKPFFIMLAGISYCDGSYDIERRNDNMYVLEYIIKGRGTVIEDGNEYTAGEGDVYLIHKGSHHRYFSSADDPWTKVFFNVYGELVENLINAYRLQTRVVYQNTGAKELFTRAYKTINSDLSTDEITAECAVYIHRIFQKLYESAKGDLNHSVEALALREYIDRRIDRGVSIEELSSSIYRSKDYTIKLFKKEFGVTPYMYMTDKKLEAARYMLLNSQASVKQIAFNIGFDDQHYFSNVFKKKFGMSPKSYREANK